MLKRIVNIANGIFQNEQNLEEELMLIPIWKEVELWGGIIYLQIEEEYLKVANAPSNSKDRSIVFNSIYNFLNKMFEYK